MTSATAEVASRAAQAIEFHDRFLARVEDDLARWISSGPNPLVIKNLDRVSRYALTNGVIVARVYKDYARARKYFQDSMKLARRIVELADQNLSIEPSNLESGVYSSLLASDQSGAAHLARSILSLRRAESSNAFFDGFARVAAAFIQDDSAAFAMEVKWVDEHCSKNAQYWWRTVHGIYHDLMDSVLTRNSSRFSVLMEKRDLAFSDRPKEKRLKDVDLRFGGNADDNLIVIDYMGTAIAIVAHQRGMTFDLKSEYVPAGLVFD